MFTTSMSVGERISLGNFLNMASTLSLEKLALLMTISGKIVVKEEEREAIKLITVGDERVQWDPGAPSKDVEFSSEEHVFLKELFRKKDHEHQYAAQDGVYLLGFINRVNGKKEKEG